MRCPQRQRGPWQGLEEDGRHGQRQPSQRRREPERRVDARLIGEHAADGWSAEDAEPVDAAEHGEGLSPLCGSNRLGDVGMARQRPERGADTPQEPQQHESRELVAPDETKSTHRDETGAEDHRGAQPGAPQYRASGNIGQQRADGGGAGGKSD